MSSRFLDLLDLTFCWGMTYLAHSTGVLVVVWLVTRFRRLRSQALLEQVWKCAAILALASTPLAMSARVTRPRGEIQATKSKQAESPLIVARSEDAASEVAPLDTKTLVDVSINVPTTIVLPKTVDEAPVIELSDATIPMVVAQETTGPRPATASSSPPMVMARWFGGGAILLSTVFATVAFVVRQFRLRRRFKDAVALQRGRAHAALRRLRKDLAVRRPIRLFESDQLEEPAAFGTLRWSIGLPNDFDQHTTHGELRAILAHEVAHLARGDTKWIHVGNMLRTVFVWQPLNRVAIRGWQEAAEFASDRWATGRGVSSLDLAHGLTTVAALKLNGRASPQPAASGSTNAVSRRVKELVADDVLDRWATKRRRWACRAIAIVIGIVVSSWGPPATAQPSTDEQQDRRTIQAWKEATSELEEMEHDLDIVRDRVTTLRRPELVHLAKSLESHVERLRSRRTRLAKRMSQHHSDLGAE